MCLAGNKTRFYLHDQFIELYVIYFNTQKPNYCESNHPQFLRSRPPRTNRALTMAGRGADRPDRCGGLNGSVAVTLTNPVASTCRTGAYISDAVTLAVAITCTRLARSQISNAITLTDAVASWYCNSPHNSVTVAIAVAI